VLARPAEGPGAATGWRAPLRRAALTMLQGLPIAALLFFMFPRLAAPLWGLPADRGARTGLSDIMEPGTFTSLTLSDDVAFRVEFDGAVPPPSQRYWRGPILSRYDGRTWTVVPLPLLPGVPTPTRGRPVAYTVTLEPGNQPFFFALDLPASTPQATGNDGGATLPTFLGMTQGRQLLSRAPIAFSLEIFGGAAARGQVALFARDTRVTCNVGAGAALTVTLMAPTRERGRIPLGRLIVSSDFPLGLWRGWAYVHFPLEGIAYPAPEPAPPPLPRGLEGADAQAPARGGDADLAGLRTYQRGDPPQRVAWKAVARGAGWYTKAFDGAQGGGPAVLDWDALAPLDGEARLSRLTAWVLAAERAARPFTLRLPGFELPQGQGREHRRAALTALALWPSPQGRG